MITAVDTNVLLDILDPRDSVHQEQATAAVQRSFEQGRLIISTIVYAELAPRFRSQNRLDSFLGDVSIHVVEMSATASFLAGTLFADHLRRGGKRDRILPDYLVGAHAIALADRLLTRDGRFYGSTFANLHAVSPAEIAVET